MLNDKYLGYLGQISDYQKDAYTTNLIVDLYQEPINEYDRIKEGRLIIYLIEVEAGFKDLNYYDMKFVAE